MDLYTTYTKEQINDEAIKNLQIAYGFYDNMQSYLKKIKDAILISDNTIIGIIAAINAGFNVILYGPPGTAKSTLSSYIPQIIYGAKCNIHTADSEWNVRKVIGGISVGSEKDSSGTFKEVIKPHNGYITEDIIDCYINHLQTKDFSTTFSIIDEFNRTNMDECLGPMFTALGSDNKELKLDYNKGFNDGFLSIPVPQSYRMICNMNKYDRTFTNELSDALSRRFKWIYVGPPSKDLYGEEKNIIDNKIYSDIVTTAIEIPANLQDIIKYEKYELFDNLLVKEVFDLIDDLRADLPIGTSYKIDTLKIAYHYLILKLSLIDWSSFPESNMNDLLKVNDIDSEAAKITDETIKENFISLIKGAINETIDETLAMTIIPACEALEDIESIERNKARFGKYVKCSIELNRMKQLF